MLWGTCDGQELTINLHVAPVWLLSRPQRPRARPLFPPRRAGGGISTCCRCVARQQRAARQQRRARHPAAKRQQPETWPPEGKLLLLCRLAHRPACLHRPPIHAARCSPARTATRCAQSGGAAGAAGGPPPGLHGFCPGHAARQGLHLLPAARARLGLPPARRVRRGGSRGGGTRAQAYRLPDAVRVAVPDAARSSSGRAPTWPPSRPCLQAPSPSRRWRWSWWATASCAAWCGCSWPPRCGRRCLAPAGLRQLAGQKAASTEGTAVAAMASCAALMARCCVRRRRATGVPPRPARQPRGCASSRRGTARCLRLRDSEHQWARCCTDGGEDAERARARRRDRLAAASDPPVRAVTYPCPPEWTHHDLDLDEQSL